MPTIEYSSLNRHEDFLAGSTFQALCALPCSAILDNVSVINQAIVIGQSPVEAEILPSALLTLMARLQSSASVLVPTYSKADH
jgi:hypothetical protein